MRNNGRNDINTPQRRFNSGAAQTETAHASNFSPDQATAFFSVPRSHKAGRCRERNRLYLG